MKTLEEWVAEHGSVIITSDNDHPMNSTLTAIAQQSALVNEYAVVVVTRPVEQHYKVVRRCTEEEFLTQMQAADPATKAEEFLLLEYFFEVKPIVM